jgi:hypothetical protein
VSGGGTTSGPRRAPRVAIRLEAAYEDPERQVFLPTRDLSESGVFLLAPDPPPVGAAASVLVELPGEPVLLRLKGVVTRSEPGTGFALRFEGDLPDAWRAALRELGTGEGTVRPQ